MGFPLESDRLLVQAVEDTRATDINLKGVPGEGSLKEPYVLPVSTLQVLLAIGRASAGAFGPVRPLFYANARWALLRWFWAFDWSVSDTAPSEWTPLIRNHHRTAFSEAMGLGFALLVVEQLSGQTLPLGVRRGGPLLVDVDTWLPGGTRSRPDLVVFFGGAKGSSTYVIEAKGNSVGRDKSLRQLATGIDQTLAARGTAERIVVGAAVPDDGFTAHAIKVKRGAGSGSKPPESSLSLESAREVSPAFEIARLQEFAGGTDDDLDLPGAPVHFEIPEQGIDAVGRRVTLGDGRLKVDLKFGVDRTVLSRLPELGSLEELSQMRSEVQALSRLPDQQPAESLFEAGEVSARALDGCALWVGLR
jgi:hypothetical protein